MAIRLRGKHSDEKESHIIKLKLLHLVELKG